jgi:hypothetical protein
MITTEVVMDRKWQIAATLINTREKVKLPEISITSKLGAEYNHICQTTEIAVCLLLTDKYTTNNQTSLILSV